MEDILSSIFFNLIEMCLYFSPNIFTGTIYTFKYFYKQNSVNSIYDSVEYFTKFNFSSSLLLKALPIKKVIDLYNKQQNHEDYFLYIRWQEYLDFIYCIYFTFI